MSKPPISAKSVYSSPPPSLTFLTQSRGFSPNVWSDAYLAAFAVVGGYEVVTFDRGFTQFANLKVTILT